MAETVSSKATKDKQGTKKASYLDRPWLKSYDPGVPADVDIPADQTFVDLLMEGFGQNPNRTALHFLGNAITFRELDRMSRRFGRFLHDQGLSTGDVVAINLPNVPQYLIALIGAHRAGLATTGVSVLLTPKELAYQLNDSGAKALVIMDQLFEQNLVQVADEVPGLKYVFHTSVGEFLPGHKRVLGNLLKKIPAGKTHGLPGKHVAPMAGVLASAPPFLPKIDIKPEDPCLIQYTGGTTGTPKGVVLTHGNVVANFTQARHWTEFEMG
ncbi:MAG: AMP-binding protein, partial [Deltaproteobacteria bacterium]|nr:AMP-binding protein [Deltaproteobacteria bacterium]